MHQRPWAAGSHRTCEFEIVAGEQLVHFQATGWQILRKTLSELRQHGGHQRIDKLNARTVHGGNPVDVITFYVIPPGSVNLAQHVQSGMGLVYLKTVALIDHLQVAQIFHHNHKVTARRINLSVINGG